VQLFLIYTLSESLSNPLITAQLATGNIRNYQLVVGGLQLLNLPASYLFLKLGAVPEVTVMVAIAVSQICLFARLYMLKGMISLPVREFIRKVYMNVIIVSAAALILPWAVNQYMPGDFWGFLARVSVCVVSALLSVILLGLSRGERHEIVEMLKTKMAV
jgi:hypothetical protein